MDILICDSTNALRVGVSPSEAEVAGTLREIIAGAQKRVAVTTFASNIARLRSVIAAAQDAGRHIVVTGRAMERMLQVARETGYLPAGTELLSDEEYGYLPRDKVVLLCTGSQGEARGALARIAADSHPRVTFAPGDAVIFSSRTIPGNEKAVGRIKNSLIDAGVEVITDADALVHCSGHPRQDELKQLYSWLKPRIAIPMHGEAQHLSRHARLAAEVGAQTLPNVRNGSLVRLAPAPAQIIDEVPAGRLHVDGGLVVDGDDDSLRERRKLSFAGIVTVAFALSRSGDLRGEPQIDFTGIPRETGEGTAMEEIIHDAVQGALDGIPRPRRRDAALVSEAVRRAVRATLQQAWGKKPLCTVAVTVI
ncbi:MAG: ribonuclease J [Alphaproteobacteria bacterium]|nr:MAG: ribonuclease J [Alphaproteobacteria bacterium]